MPDVERDIVDAIVRDLSDRALAALSVRIARVPPGVDR